MLGQQKRIAELHGRERIQTAWWTDAPCHRDYYRAVTETGGRLWIYRDLQSGNWYLHGRFDEFEWRAVGVSPLVQCCV